MENTKWRPLRDCNSSHISQQNQRTGRDTLRLFGRIENNGLPTGTGHNPDDLANKNPGANALATGDKDAMENSCLPPKDSPEWDGAPAIILLHFCGVTA
jgi:hypothetical protein